ncbi:unnamed protein product, partial [Staurois parvus]
MCSIGTRWDPREAADCLMVYVEPDSPSRGCPERKMSVFSLYRWVGGGGGQHGGCCWSMSGFLHRR